MDVSQMQPCDVWHQILSNLCLSHLVLLSRVSKTWHEHTSIDLHSNHYTNTVASRIYTTWLINAICFDIHRNILKTDSQFYKIFYGNYGWFDYYRKMYNNNIVIDILNNKISSTDKKRCFVKNILPFIAIECDRYLLLIQYCEKQDIFTLNARDSDYSRSKTENMKQKNVNKCKNDLEWYNKDKSYKTQILLKHVKYQVDKMIENNNHETTDNLYNNVSYNIGCVLRLINYIGQLINQLKRQFIGINECIGNDMNQKRYPYKCEFETSGIYLKLFEVFNYFNHVALQDKHNQQRRTNNINIYKYYTIELIFKLILSEFGDKIDLISDIDVQLQYGRNRWTEFEQNRNNKSFNGHDWFDFTKQLLRSNRHILICLLDCYDSFACYSISKQMSEYEEKTAGFDSTGMPKWRFYSAQTKQDYQVFKKASLYVQQPKYFHTMGRFNFFQMYKLCCLNKIDYSYYNTIGIFRNGIVLAMYVLSNAKTMAQLQRKTQRSSAQHMDAEECNDHINDSMQDNKNINTKKRKYPVREYENLLEKWIRFNTSYKIAPQRLTANVYRGRFGANLHIFQTAYGSFRSAIFLIEYELSLKHVDKKYEYLFLKPKKLSTFKIKYSKNNKNGCTQTEIKQRIFVNEMNATIDSEMGNTLEGMICMAFLHYKKILFHCCNDLKSKKIFDEKKIVINGLRMRYCVKREVKRRLMSIKNQIHIDACA